MRHTLLLLAGTIGVCLGLVRGMAAATAGKSIPPFSEAQQAVSRYFGARENFRSGDLITREDVEPLLAQLQKKGLPLSDAGQILQNVPAKGEFLVDQLGTPDGRKFMRRIAAYPDAYDRLDRLSRMPHGQQTIRDLIRGPGGEKMIEYMTTTSGGKELGKMLANAPTGEKFNAPTGRIYTVELLLARLQQSHAAAVKVAAGKSKISP